MKLKFLRTVWMALLLFAAALASEGVLAATPLRIMPLGDSITWGEPVPGGYRLPLWNLFAQAGYMIDYVGTQQTNPSGELPDNDHQGMSCRFCRAAPCCCSAEVVGLSESELSRWHPAGKSC